MSWTKALDFTPKPVQAKPSPIRRSKAPCGRRSVVIKGVRYESLKDARNKLGLRNYSQVYKLLGEKWRYGHFG